MQSKICLLNGCRLPTKLCNYKLLKKVDAICESRSKWKAGNLGARRKRQYNIYIIWIDAESSSNKLKLNYNSANQHMEYIGMDVVDLEILWGCLVNRFQLFCLPHVCNM